MVDINTLQILVFVSAVAGAFGRTMLPYLQKLKEAEEGDKPVFQHKYFFTMIYSLAISLGTTMTLFPTLMQNLTTNVGIPSMMIVAGLTGWGSNSIVNAITSSVNPAEIKAENAKLRKTEGTKAVTKEGGIQLGDKTIS